MGPERLARGCFLYGGDCLEILEDIDDNTIDSIVTDPPYGLEFMGVAWDSFAEPKGSARTKDDWKDYGSREHARNATQTARIARNKNLAFGVFTEKWAAECLRVLKPGGHLLSFGGTRTYHRMACAIEDAGFEVRDCIQWIYGSGFPKSANVSKQIDKAAGAERKVIGSKVAEGGNNFNAFRTGEGRADRPPSHNLREMPLTAPATDAAREWEGWGTALKPACEPIVLARKPLSESTVAANVLKWGTGALNIDACRVAVDPKVDDMLRTVKREKRQTETWEKGSGFKNETNHLTGVPANGRWPANVILSYPDDQYELKSDVTNQQRKELFRWLSENA